MISTPGLSRIKCDKDRKRLVKRRPASGMGTVVKDAKTSNVNDRECFQSAPSLSSP